MAVEDTQVWSFRFGQSKICISLRDLEEPLKWNRSRCYDEIEIQTLEDPVPELVHCLSQLMFMSGPSQIQDKDCCRWWGSIRQYLWAADVFQALWSHPLDNGGHGELLSLSTKTGLF